MACRIYPSRYVTYLFPPGPVSLIGGIHQSRKASFRRLVQRILKRNGMSYILHTLLRKKFTSHLSFPSRLLYVACTRAQALLYLTHASSRMMAGETVSKRLSEFVSVLPGVPLPPGSSDPTGLFSSSPPDLTKAECATLAKVLRRVPPDDAEVRRRVAELERAGKASLWTAAPEQAPTGFSSAASWGKGSPAYQPYRTEYRPPLDTAPVFVSAKSVPFKPPSRAAYRNAPTRPLSPSKELNSEPPTTSSAVILHGSERLKSENQAPKSRAKTAKELPGGPKQASLETFIQRKETSTVRLGVSRTVAGAAVSKTGSVSKASSMASRPAPLAASISRSAMTSALPSSESSSPGHPPVPVPKMLMAQQSQQPLQLAGSKRRLGMGRTTVGYQNKKFKTPGGGA